MPARLLMLMVPGSFFKQGAMGVLGLGGKRLLAGSGLLAVRNPKTPKLLENKPKKTYTLKLQNPKP